MFKENSQTICSKSRREPLLQDKGGARFVASRRRNDTATVVWINVTKIHVKICRIAQIPIRAFLTRTPIL